MKLDLSIKQFYNMLSESERLEMLKLIANGMEESNYKEEVTSPASIKQDLIEGMVTVEAFRKGNWSALGLRAYRALGKCNKEYIHQVIIQDFTRLPNVGFITWIKFDNLRRELTVKNK